VDIPCERIILDPGIGFGKSHNHNLQLLKHLDSITQLGYPVLMGHSRKRFIGQILAPPIRNPEDQLEILPVEQRMIGSLGVVADSYKKGARIFRVHDVQETREILRVLSAIDRVED
jgi:dihydropteroate synthase